MTAVRPDLSKVTARPWHRVTEGNKSIRSAAGKVTRSLFRPPVDREVRDSMTNLTFIVTDDGALNVALIGNGPKQIPNAEFIVYAANNIERVEARLARLEKALLDIEFEASEARKSSRAAWSAALVAIEDRAAEAVLAAAPEEE